MMLGASMAGKLGAELLWAGIVPLAAAAVAMLVARLLKLRPRAAWAVSVGMGYVVGQFGLVSRAGVATALNALVAPHEARDWLPWAVVLAAGTTVWVVQATGSMRWVGHVLAIVIVLAVPARLLGGSVYLASRWTGGEKIAHLALLAAAVGVAWWLLESCKDSDQPLLRCMLLIYTAVGTAVAVTLSGSFAYGELCGVVAGALTGALLAGVLNPASPTDVDATASPDGLGGAAGVVAMSLGGLILLGYFYAELSSADALFLCVALLAAGGWLPMPAAAGSGWGGAVRAVFCIVPMALAVAGSYAATMTESASPY